MKLSSWRSMLPLTLLVALAAPAAHAAIIILDDARYVRTAESGITEPPPGASLWQVLVPTATGSVEQDSLLSPTVLWADLYVVSDGLGGVGQSVFDVTFEVDTVTPFAMVGSVPYSPVGQAFLSDSLGNVQTFTSSLETSGVFSPGVEYRLFVSVSEPMVNLQSSGNFYLQVPEARAAGLCSVGLLAALLLRRQLARRQIA